MYASIIFALLVRACSTSCGCVRTCSSAEAEQLAELASRSLCCV
uniref:Uncharacterized protein n=1 Tax=Arundo donax TaxID=35708 RepID=A0A0A8YJP8_ARUDO